MFLVIKSNNLVLNSIVFSKVKLKNTQYLGKTTENEIVKGASLLKILFVYRPRKVD
jgi:hypothetical protein